MARGSVQDASATISTTSVVVLAEDATRTGLFLANPMSSGVVIAFNLTGGTAAIGGAGSFVLQAQTSQLFDAFVPHQAITAISNVSAAAVTVQFMQGGIPRQ